MKQYFYYQHFRLYTGYKRKSWKSSGILGRCRVLMEFRPQKWNKVFFRTENAPFCFCYGSNKKNRKKWCTASLVLVNGLIPAKISPCNNNRKSNEAFICPLFTTKSSDCKWVFASRTQSRPKTGRWVPFLWWACFQSPSKGSNKEKKRWINFCCNDWSNYFK